MILHRRKSRSGPTDVGYCFVKYDDIIAAAKAQEALHGRDFDGNSVVAEFLPAGSL